MTPNLQERVNAALSTVRNNRLGINVLEAEMVRDVATTVDGKVRFTILLAPSDDATIVRSTIDLGRNLGLEVVAEGVETEQVWDRLKALGCTAAQGYYLSRAIPAPEFRAWLLERRSTHDVTAGR
jgi:EAL domain-containing protein (putative c-di-GMP-specific phosphodiesterase class I)